MSIEELKAENAYQKELIAHLKKLKGLADDEL
jgi:protease II